MARLCKKNYRRLYLMYMLVVYGVLMVLGTFVWQQKRLLPESMRNTNERRSIESPSLTTMMRITPLKVENVKKLRLKRHVAARAWKPSIAVEIWSSAAVGDYLWNHVLQGSVTTSTSFNATTHWDHSQSLPPPLAQTHLQQEERHQRRQYQQQGLFVSPGYVHGESVCECSLCSLDPGNKKASMLGRGSAETGSARMLVTLHTGRLTRPHTLTEHSLNKSSSKIIEGKRNRRVGRASRRSSQKEENVKQSRVVVLALNARGPHLLHEARLWLDTLPTVQGLSAAILVILGPERNQNDFIKWLRPYLELSLYRIHTVLLTYASKVPPSSLPSSIVTQNRNRSSYAADAATTTTTASAASTGASVLWWPLGVATYRGFPRDPVVAAAAAAAATTAFDKAKPRFLYNFQATIYPNSSRQSLLSLLKRQPDLAHGAFVRPRLKWAPHETHHGALAYRTGLLHSVYTLAPKGLSWESYRVYEALAAGSIPVLEIERESSHLPLVLDNKDLNNNSEIRERPQYGQQRQQRQQHQKQQQIVQQHVYLNDTHVVSSNFNGSAASGSDVNGAVDLQDDFKPAKYDEKCGGGALGRISRPWNLLLELPGSPVVKVEDLTHALPSLVMQWRKENLAEQMARRLRVRDWYYNTFLYAVRQRFCCAVSGALARTNYDGQHR